MRPALNRTVVVTGVGVIAPNGQGRDAFWRTLHEPAAAERVRYVRDFVPRNWFTHKGAKNADLATQLTVAAADEALSDAGLLLDKPFDGESTSDSRALHGVDTERLAVVIGTGIGGVSTLESQMEVRRDRGERLVSPFTVPMSMPNAPAATLSIRYSARAGALTMTTACAAGTDAILAAARQIASGLADVAIVGGTEAALTSTCLAGFANMRALSPTGISRPFDVNRDGLSAAEAAGVLIVEAEEHARSRGATPYMIVAGGASTSDAHHITAPAPGGAGAETAIRRALFDAEVEPKDVAHINAHGTSTSLNDAAESDAIRRVFGAHRPSVTSIKGVTGHSFGAGGALEAVAVAIGMRERSLPPTVGTSTVDPAIDLDVLLETTGWTPGPVLSNSFGFGGHNAAVVFTPVLEHGSQRVAR